MIECKITGVDVSIEKNRSKLLGPVSFELVNSNCTIVLGPNGAGKTSFLRLLHGLDKPTTGSITWDPLAKVEDQSFVFQSPVILKRNVIENVYYPLLLQGIPKKEAITQAEYWLERTSLNHKAYDPAISLSGGEKQRMVIARSLISDPKLIFLDEPTVNLDGKSKSQIEKLLKQVLNNGTKIIMATHDLGQAKRLGNDILFLHHGKLLEVGSATSFFKNPKTKEGLTFLRGEILQ
jgi:tungstate transport system ATP-binding protein